MYVCRVVKQGTQGERECNTDESFSYAIKIKIEINININNSNNNNSKGHTIYIDNNGIHITHSALTREREEREEREKEGQKEGEKNSKPALCGSKVK